MPVFKRWNLWSLFLLLAASLLLNACWGPTEKSADALNDGESSSATFYVQDITGYSTTPNVNLTKAWKAPESRLFSFKACLKDKATRKDILGHKFVVKSDEKIYDTEVLNNGCIQWVEQIGFEFYARSTYLVFDRVIQASSKSVHTGEVRVKVLVNPWVKFVGRENSPEVIYWPKNTESPVPLEHMAIGKENIMLALGGTFQKEQFPIWLEQFKIDITKTHESFKTFEEDSPDVDQAAGYDVEINLEMKPIVKLKSINGEVISNSKIKSGKFRIYAQVVATELGNDHRSKMTLTPDLPPTLASINEADGFLRATIKATIARRVVQGRLKLALRLVPVDGPANIGGYDGLFLLGHYKDLVKKGAPTLDPSMYEDGRKFNYTKYFEPTNEFDNNFEALKKANLAFDQKPFDFSIAKVNYERVKPGETATQRTIQFRVRTCVFDLALNSERVKFRQFKVKRNGEDLPLEQTRTDEEGCLNLMGEVSHAFYKAEQLIATTYAISLDRSSHLPKETAQQKDGFLQKIVVYTNPWDDKFTFGRDEREMSKEYRDDIGHRAKIVSRFFISNFTYQTLRFGYEIDKEYLDLAVKKAVLLHIEPWVLRYNGIVAGRNNKQPLRDGMYLLKLALQKDYLDPATKGVVISRKKEIDTELTGQYDVKVWNNQSERYVDLKGDELERRKRQSITAVKKLVRVNNGRIITPIELSIRDLRLMRIRSQFLIQLEPVDERLLQVANQYDAQFDSELRKSVKEKFDKILQEIELEAGSEASKQTLDYVQNAAEDLRSIDMYRYLSNDQKESVLAEIAAKQSGLEDLIKKLQMDRDRIQAKMIKIDKELAAETSAPQIEALRAEKEAYIEELLKEHSIFDKTKKAFELNDFTTMPAAPVIANLDKFVEPFEVSGLHKRTFIGPLTFLLNSNMSNVRPTDNLDENFCKEATCSSLKAWGMNADGINNDDDEAGDYRSGKFYGAIAHMTNIHVDDLLTEMSKLEFKRKRELKVRSSISNYINLFGLKYISLDRDVNKDNNLYVVNSECDSIYRPDFAEKCMIKNNEHRVQMHDFIDSYNNLGFTQVGFQSFQLGLKGVPHGEILGDNPLTAEELFEIIKTGKMTSENAIRLCEMFAKELYTGEEERSSHGRALFGRFGKIKQTCQRAARDEKNIDAKGYPVNGFPFIVDRKVKVKKLGRYIFRGGKQMNLNVGSTVNLNRDQKFGMGLGFNLGGYGKFGSHFLGDILGPIRIGADINRGKSKSESTTINEQTFLVMQMATFELSISEFERCAAIKWNPELFFPIFQSVFGDQGNDFDVPGGYFICSGEIEKADEKNKPLRVNENYFYFTQHFTDGDMLDSGDLYNHPWLLALRGDRDASRFISQLTRNKFVMANLDAKVRDKDMWPIYKMIEVYLKVLPTFPSIYTILDESEARPSFPWNEEASRINKEIIDGVVPQKNGESRNIYDRIKEQEDDGNLTEAARVLKLWFEAKEELEGKAQ